MTRRDEGDEPVQTDEALIWLTVREQAADARDQLAACTDAAGRLRVLRELAMAVRREVAILESRDVLAIREVLAVAEDSILDT